jgi:peptidoglycan/xylan/chitin deacetylase (PgdA/CDA1 family)
MRRDTLLTTAVNVLDLSGITCLLKPFYGGKGAILAFHRVLPDGATTLTPGTAVTVSQLRNILHFLKRSGMDLVHLSEVPARLCARTSRRFVAITLDDGYRDNFEQGLPVFREFGAPFSVFPCTGFLNRTDFLWVYLLEALCLRKDRVTWRHPEKGQVEFMRSTEEDKLAFFRRVESHAWYQPGIGNCLAEACEAEGMPVGEINNQLFLSWEQLKLISQDPLATIGVHTMTHPSLGSLKENEAETEIATAREELEKQLGVPVQLIAYPFGSPEACGPREFRMAQRMGFTIGLTTKRGNVYSHNRNSLWSLPRHTLSMAPHSLSNRYLRISLNGIWDTPLNGTVFTR